jgi:hypothetical protein
MLFTKILTIYIWSNSQYISFTFLYDFCYIQFIGNLYFKYGVKSLSFLWYSMSLITIFLFSLASFCMNPVLVLFVGIMFCEFCSCSHIGIWEHFSHGPVSGRTVSLLD